MSTKVLYHPRNLEIDLSESPRWLYDEVASLRGQIDKSDPPVLTCLGNGQPMYVFRHESGRYFARHFRNGNPDQHRHLIATMSDEHRREAEYTARAAADHGLDAPLEVSTGNGTRLDVAVYGEINTGFEIQRSALSRIKAKSRATKSFKAGWPTAWVSDNEKDPDWLDHVPTARLLTRGIFSDGMPSRNKAQVSIRKFFRRKVGLNRYRYDSEPRAVLLDELAWRIPAGHVEIVATGTKGRVMLAAEGAGEIIDSCTYEGASRWKPAAAAPRHKESAQRLSSDCHHESTPQRRDAPLCRGCGRPSWFAARTRDGYCIDCGWDLNRGNDW